MKKVEGVNFSVRFFRRGVTKGAAKNEPRLLQDKEDEKVAAPLPLRENVYMPAATAKEKILRDAAQNGDCYVIRTLVMEGVDLEARDDLGRTALNIATQYNRQDAIKTLLAAREMRRLAKQGELPDTAFFRKFQDKKTGNS